MNSCVNIIFTLRCLSVIIHNKQAVQRILDLPEDGSVYMNANVAYEKKPFFDIYYKQTTEKDGEINFNNNRQKTPSQKEETLKNDPADN